MIFFLISIAAYLIPILLLFYIAIEIYLRDVNNATYKVVSYFFLSMMILMLGFSLLNFTPQEYAHATVVIFILIPAFLTMSLQLHFIASLVGKHLSLSRPVLLTLCNLSALPILIVVLPLNSLTLQYSKVGIYTYVYPSDLLKIILLITVIYTSIVTASLLTAFFRRTKSSTAFQLKRKQVSLITYCFLITGSIATAFGAYLKRPDFIPNELGLPHLASYGLFVAALCIRFVMVKYDFLPSVDKKYQILYEKSPISILLLDEQMIIRDANPEAAVLFQYSRRELINQNLNSFLSEPSSPTLLTDIFTINTASGEVKFVKAESEYVVTEGEQFLFLVLLDISDVKIAERKANYHASHDPLTGLANRYMFSKYLDEQLTKSIESQAPFALLVIDLDGFKLVNDTLGHHAGDEILIQVAKLLEARTNNQTFIARFGGDEFGLIIPNIESIDALQTICKNVLEGFNTPFIYNNKSFSVTASIGVCFYPAHGVKAEELLQHADYAMYHGKKLGKNRFVIYDSSIRNDTDRLYLTVESVKKGLADGKFELHYQPQIDIRSGKITGTEALIRWNYPENSMMTPSKFIPLAEESGAIVEIGYWVLDTACDQLKKWMDEKLPPIQMSINLSAKQFLDLHFPERLANTLARTGVNPNLLCLEITEHTAMTNEQYSLNICEQILNMGVKLSIDDFGTGYSSLSMLKNLSVHSIKIDRSFIKDMIVDENDRAIIKAIIAMSHNLGKRVIAEGVELSGQWDMLEEFGCDDIQGYYVSKPLSANDCYHFINDRNSSSVKLT